MLLTATCLLCFSFVLVTLPYRKTLQSRYGTKSQGIDSWELYCKTKSLNCLQVYTFVVYLPDYESSALVQAAGYLLRAFSAKSNQLPNLSELAPLRIGRPEGNSLEGSGGVRSLTEKN